MGYINISREIKLIRRNKGIICATYSRTEGISKLVLALNNSTYVTKLFIFLRRVFKNVAYMRLDEKFKTFYIPGCLRRCKLPF